MENEAAVLSLLFSNLGYKAKSTPEEIKTLIESKLDAADARIQQCGLDPAVDNQAMRELRVMYASYLYLHRNSQSPMPQSLRLAINDAKVAASAATEEAQK